MNNSIFKVISLFVFLLAGHSIFGQLVKINPFPIQPSSLIDDLKSLKKASPKISDEDLVKAANIALDTQGLNYTFSFDTALCQKLVQMKNTQKDKNAPFNLRGSLKAVEGEPANLILPVVQFGGNECAVCSIQIPLLEITNESFVTIVRKNNIKFFMPGEFNANEAVLLDGKNPTTVLTRWKLPFRTVPLSVSDDGKILYIGFNDAELENLALMIFEEGVFQFCTKKDFDAGKKIEITKDASKENPNQDTNLATFTKGNLKQTVRFNSPCS